MSSKDLMSISNKYGKYRFIQIDTKSNNISSLVAEISKIGKPAARNK
jgi:hypothetical protein